MQVITAGQAQGSASIVLKLSRHDKHAAEQVKRYAENNQNGLGSRRFIRDARADPRDRCRVTAYRMNACNARCRALIKMFSVTMRNTASPEAEKADVGQKPVTIDTSLIERC